MQPPTWLLTGLAGVVIGIAGLGIGYELRGDGSDGQAVTAEPTVVALPTSCAYFTAVNERINDLDRKPTTPISLEARENFLNLWAKACR